MCLCFVAHAVVASIKPLFRLDNPLLHQALFPISSINDIKLRGACRK